MTDQESQQLFNCIKGRLLRSALDVDERCYEEICNEETFFSLCDRANRRAKMVNDAVFLNAVDVLAANIMRYMDVLGDAQPEDERINECLDTLVNSVIINEKENINAF